jgi:hypothetical protein
MTNPQHPITQVDESVLRDMESKYASTACPIHGNPASFEVGPDGAVVERFCCDALLRIVRELQSQDPEELR